MLGYREFLQIFGPQQADEPTHAAYPTAFRALCGRPLDELEGIPGPAKHTPPACEPCRTTAERFDQIDRSAPPAWFRGGSVDGDPPWWAAA